MSLAEHIGRIVILENSRGARFQGTLKGVLTNGNAILKCTATNVGNGWVEHGRELRVVEEAKVVEE